MTFVFESLYALVLSGSPLMLCRKSRSVHHFIWLQFSPDFENHWPKEFLIVRAHRERRWWAVCKSLGKFADVRFLLHTLQCTGESSLLPSTHCNPDFLITSLSASKGMPPPPFHSVRSPRATVSVPLTEHSLVKRFPLHAIPQHVPRHTGGVTPERAGWRHALIWSRRTGLGFSWQCKRSRAVLWHSSGSSVTTDKWDAWMIRDQPGEMSNN